MRVQLQRTGEFLELQTGQQLGSGGEARIFSLPDHPTWAAKIWHKPTLERAHKVTAMLANPPLDPMTGQGHVAIAWPVDLLLLPGPPPRVVGFVMPRVTGMRPVIDFFNPKTRLRVCPLYTWFYLHRTARNLVTAIRALHERGYVVGDLNESNILASETALVTLVDTDSFQVWDAETGTLYRCRVGRPEFTPPEMQGHSFARVNREPAQDLFGVGTLIFQLLMEGTHPFAGVYHGPGEAPVFAERIAAGHFPHVASAGVPYSPAPAAPKFGWLHPVLQDLFVRCFCDGHRDPSHRPDAVSWQYGLEEAEAALVSCETNAQHVFSNHLDHCPWCERKELLGGRDPFPSPEAVQRKEHLKPLPRRRRPRSLPRRTTAWGTVATYPIPGRRKLPQPPPIPRGQSSPASPSGWFDTLRWVLGLPHRNTWAWAALAVAGLAWVLLPAGSLRPLTPLVALTAMGLGVWGKRQADDWPHTGAGRRTAQIAIGLSAVALLLQGFL
jgi:DNA-binding helix-hairpin-helix protein with protein kinase domain